MFHDMKELEWGLHTDVGLRKGLNVIEELLEVGDEKVRTWASLNIKGNQALMQDIVKWIR